MPSYWTNHHRFLHKIIFLDPSLGQVACSNDKTICQNGFSNSGCFFIWQGHQFDRYCESVQHEKIYFFHFCLFLQVQTDQGGHVDLVLLVAAKMTAMLGDADNLFVSFGNCGRFRCGGQCKYLYQASSSTEEGALLFYTCPTNKFPWNSVKMSWTIMDNMKHDHLQVSKILTILVNNKLKFEDDVKFISSWLQISFFVNLKMTAR